MLIVCPSCSKSYQVGASAIGAAGRSVRCVGCRTIWFAEPPVEKPALLAPEPATDEVVSAFRSELGGEAEAPPTAGEMPAEPDAPMEAPSIEPPSSPPGPPETAAAADLDPAEPAAPVALSDIPIPVTGSPPLAPGADEAGSARPAIENANVESAARRRRAKAAPRRTKSNGRMPLVIVALAVVCAGLLVWRKDVVRHMPQLASFYASVGLPVNLRGLTFTGLTVGHDTHDGIPVLTVEGTIVNRISTAVEVPRLRFALLNAAGIEVYSWTAVPSQNALEAGAQLPFRSRLASPPDDGHDVQVRFFTRRDVAAGTH